MIARIFLVLAMTNAGSVIPALIRSKDYNNISKVVVLSDLRLCQAAFPAFYTQEFQMLFTRNYKVNFKHVPISILSFFEEPDSRT